MDSVVINDLQEYIYEKTFNTDPFFHGKRHQDFVLVHENTYHKLSAWFKFRALKFTPNKCIGLPIHCKLTFTKKGLINKLKDGYFKDSTDNFYAVKNAQFKKDILTVHLRPIELQMYFDIIPEDIKMILMFYLNKQDSQSLIKIKSNFIVNDVFWQRLAAYRFPKYFKVFNEVIKNWKWYYLDLVELDNKHNLDTFMNTPMRTYVDIDSLLYRSKLRYLYPYLSKIESSLPLHDIHNILYKVFNNVEIEYLKTGELSRGSTIRHYINITNPIILYDLVRHPNFSISSSLELIIILKLLRSDKELYNKYISELKQENGFVLEELIQHLSKGTYTSEEMKTEILEILVSKQ